MKIICTTFFLLISLTFFAQSDIEGDYELLKNLSINGKTYTIYSKSNDKKFKFKVIEKDTSFVTTEYTNDIDSNTFYNFFTAFLKSNFDSDLDSNTLPDNEKNDITQLSASIQIVERKKAEAKRSELENLLFLAEQDIPQYSAKIKLNKHVPYKLKSGKDAPSHGNVTFFTKDSSDTDSQPLLEVTDAKITFFNNKASSIYIKAILKKDSLTEELIFVNNQFSVALPFFNRYGSVVSTKTKNREWITIDYNDVFDYEMDQNFNYSIANGQVTLSYSANSDFKPEARVIQRRFFDFFTAVVYSDVMGFNTENSNPLLNAQAKLLIPLHLINNEKWSFGRQFFTTANIALSNSFENENRFISISDDESFSGFELLKRNNMYGELGIEAITHEAKGWFMNIGLGYKVKFYRTGFRYTQTQVNVQDIVTNRQLLSLGHGPFLNFEIRPQNNFGADVMLSLEDLNFADSNTMGERNFNDDIILNEGKDHFIFAYNMINVNASFYWLTNPDKSKGGIYANLGGFFHTESNSIFPQLMVGYATNLTSFVNRFKSEKSTKAITDSNN